MVWRELHPGVAAVVGVKVPSLQLTRVELNRAVLMRAGIIRRPAWPREQARLWQQIRRWLWEQIKDARYRAEVLIFFYGLVGRVGLLLFLLLSLEPFISVERLDLLFSQLLRGHDILPRLVPEQSLPRCGAAEFKFRRLWVGLLLSLAGLFVALDLVKQVAELDVHLHVLLRLARLVQPHHLV